MIPVNPYLVRNTFVSILRDRLLHAVIGVGLGMILLVPVVSLFSMRQVQELSITLSLSCLSFILLIVSLLLGASSIWREIERRYTASVLALPVSRTTYLFSKIVGISLFILLCGLLLGMVSAGIIYVSAARYPSEIPVHWGNIAVVVCADILKYTLLSALALLFSAVSTSFFLPFFGTLCIYFAGSASQEVFEYVTGTAGQDFSPLALAVTKAVYYLLPNFAAFNFKIQAIYALAVPLQSLFYALGYFCIYTCILLWIGAWSFSRRPLP